MAELTLAPAPLILLQIPSMPPWVFVSVIGLAAFVVASFFILMFFAALLEKHPLARFTPADFAELPEPSPYFLAVNESARKLGFEFLGAYKQKRQTAVYGAYFAAWLSPDNKTVLRIVGGGLGWLSVERCSRCGAAREITNVG